jgi:hypothetical protein
MMRTVSVALSLCCAALVGSVHGGEAPGGRLEEVKIELPPPVFRETPPKIALTEYVEKPSGKPRAPFLAPPGTKNVALKKPVTGSDDAPFTGELSMLTDGDKKGNDGSFIELASGRQWVQIDLQAQHSIYAILVWHYHGALRIYHDVVVQVADDADFITNVRTVFSNDYDNSSGLGIGKDLEYFENNEGRLMPCRNLVARYVRLYSKGSTTNEQNHYVEAEVYGTPAK